MLSELWMGFPILLRKFHPAESLLVAVDLAAESPAAQYNILCVCAAALSADVTVIVVLEVYVACSLMCSRSEFAWRHLGAEVN